MSPALANFLFETANFLVLAGALAWFSFKPLRKALNAERERHTQQQARLEQMHAEAKSLEQAAHAAQQSLDEQLKQRRAQLLAAAEDEAARIKNQAREAVSVQQRALERDHLAAGQAQGQVFADTLGRITAASLRSLLGHLEGPALDLALVRGACAQLSSMPAAARQAALVETARPLDAATRELLASQLVGDFEERLAPELGAGVRVTTRAAQVDATAVALARQAAHEVVDISAQERHHDAAAHHV